MYELVKIRDKVRVPPAQFGKNLTEALLTLTQQQYEGLLDEDLGVIVAVTQAVKNGEGKVILGDGAAYYDTELEMLVYKPRMQEVIEGVVSETTEFGAFVRIGPIDGLVHVSQIMDEFINYDSKNTCFIGKDSGRKLKKEDAVTARIVTISLKGAIADSKLGLTMRQPFLGKKEWNTGAPAEKKPAAGKKEKMEKQKPDKAEEKK